MQYVIDQDKFEQGVRDAGFRSVSALAQRLGVHRNSLYHYLSGKNGVYPTVLSNAFELLGIEPSEVIIRDSRRDRYDLKVISPLVDRLQSKYSVGCYILFGSRSKKTHKEFSDFDIGLYASNKIAHDVYFDLVEYTAVLAEDLPVEVQLVDLSSATDEFLLEAIPGAKFLGGSLTNWLALKERILDE